MVPARGRIEAAHLYVRTPVAIYGLMGRLNRKGYPVLHPTEKTVVVPCFRRTLSVGDRFYAPHPELWELSRLSAEDWARGGGAGRAREGWELRSHLEWGTPLDGALAAAPTIAPRHTWWACTHGFFGPWLKRLGFYMAERPAAQGVVGEPPELDGMARRLWRVKQTRGPSYCSLSYSYRAHAESAVKELLGGGDLYSRDYPDRTTGLAVELLGGSLLSKLDGDEQHRRFDAARLQCPDAELREIMSGREVGRPEEALLVCYRKAPQVPAGTEGRCGRVHHISMQEPHFSHLCAGTKIYEIGPACGPMLDVGTGDCVVWECEGVGRPTEVLGVAIYGSYEEALTASGVQYVLPWEPVDDIAGAAERSCDGAPGEVVVLSLGLI